MNITREHVGDIMSLSRMDNLSTIQAIGLDWRPHALDLALLIVVISIACTYFQHGLARIPGPFLASVSPAWRLLTVWKEDAPRRSIALHKKYGPVVRVGPKHVSVSSPEALQLVYSFKTAFAKV